MRQRKSLTELNERTENPPSGYRIDRLPGRVFRWVHESSGEAGFRNWDRGLVVYAAWQHFKKESA